MTTDVCAGVSLVYVDTRASAFSQVSAYSCKGVVADGVVSTRHFSFGHACIARGGQQIARLQLSNAAMACQSCTIHDMLSTCMDISAY